MNLSLLSINGFRSLKAVAWNPGPLNVLIGPNGSGKTNLLKALQCLTASAQGRLGKYVQREGGMGAITWEGSAEAITFVFMPLPSPNATPFNLYQLALQRLGAASSYAVMLEQFNSNGSSHISQAEPLAFFRQGTIGHESSPKNKRRRIKRPLLEEETLLSAYGGPFDGYPAASEFRAWIASWAVYTDFLTHAEAPVRRPVISRHEPRLDGNGENLVNVLHSLYVGSRDFQREVDLAMRAAFGEDYEALIFAPDADQRIGLRVRWKSSKRDQGVAELSDGTLRFLFLVAALANPEPPPLIAIDEPETGLHPSMLAVVAELAATAAQRTQVVLTTHSAELLDGFRESDPRPTITVVAREEGATVLRNVEGEALEEWLHAYTLGSLFRSGELESLR